MEDYQRHAVVVLVRRVTAKCIASTYTFFSFFSIRATAYIRHPIEGCHGSFVWLDNHCKLLLFWHSKCVILKKFFNVSANSLSLTLRTSKAGISALRKLHCRVGSQYTGGTVCQRQASDAGIPALFSNAYWHWNARVIEIHTRQQLKNVFSHETQ